MAHAYNSQLDAFDLYHRAHEAHTSGPSSSPGGSSLSALGHALAGSTGSAVSNLWTYPLDLVITRLQIQRQLRKDPSKPSHNEYKGIEDAARRIYLEEGGIHGFYAGVLQDTGKTIADSFLFFLAYNFLRQRRIMTRSKKSSPVILTAIEELTIGFIAGSLTKLLTTPVANIVTKKQAAALLKAQSPPSSPSSGRHKTSPQEVTAPSTADIAREILRQNGVAGFWTGYSASLILTLNPALTFFLFETFKRILPSSRRETPPATATFLMAALSKACASSITYPFSLAKARAQACGKDEWECEGKAVSSRMQDATNGNLSGGHKEQAAARATIFSTILQISQTDGILGLYEGLPLEIVKAFFSHGITMTVKQAMHRLLLEAYYIVSIVVSKYKSRAKTEKPVQRAKEQSREYYDLAKARAAERLATAKHRIQIAQKGAGGALEDVTDGVQQGLGKANETAELVADYVEEEAEEWRTLYGTGLARWFVEK